jgi:hypothetical protein
MHSFSCYTGIWMIRIAGETYIIVCSNEQSILLLFNANILFHSLFSRDASANKW